MNRRAAAPSLPVQWGTKAENLFQLQERLRHAIVPRTYYFSVAQWQSERDNILSTLRQTFKVDQADAVAIRSSSSAEDGQGASLAGAFHSVLDVPVTSPQQLADAVNEVVSSYTSASGHQVLVQAMVRDVAMSGVMMTRDLETGAPYFVINYDDVSGQTDTVTGGRGVNKTLRIHRQADTTLIESERILNLFRLGHELEALYAGTPLDIEFAVDGTGTCHLLQVRPIATAAVHRPHIARRINDRLTNLRHVLADRFRPHPGLLGRTTILGLMPDWNPAEIIGTTPGGLAISLYRELVTRSVWREARSRMGYRRLPAEDLMVDLGGRPYIDVRCSFNSFLPAELDEDVGARLVDHWLNTLDQNPSLHDKVEFEVAITCTDFTLERRLDALSSVLGTSERRHVRESYVTLTREALDYEQGSFACAQAAIVRIANRQARRPLPSGNTTARDSVLRRASFLLRECRTYGTLPFAILARHAFIAESLLRSAVERGALARDRVALLKRSTGTITTQFFDDLMRVGAGTLDATAFMKRFGHLRPGTYDITSKRYVDRGDLFATPSAMAETDVAPFELRPVERASIETLLAETGLDVLDADGLIQYARRAIIAREYAKFVFTRNLSDLLELIAQWGKKRGLSRDDLSHVNVRDILAPVSMEAMPEAYELTARSQWARARREAARSLPLGFLIRDTRDLYVIPQHRTEPNFIGRERLDGRIAHIDAHTASDVDLDGRIVCIENADPGFDWIFTRSIGGLITKYGGANSHMAIRCAELGIPAAIGCGEQTFARLVAASMVELDGSRRLLRPTYGT